ncbi:hypothetical protein ABGB07_45625 [Micromonosporaceae bacterium B7E4]
MTDDRWQPWRLPPARLATAHALGLGGRARMAAGVRAVVRTDAAALELETFAADEDVTSLDVVVDGDLWRREPPAAGAAGGGSVDEISQGSRHRRSDGGRLDHDQPADTCPAQRFHAVSDDAGQCG